MTRVQLSLHRFKLRGDKGEDGSIFSNGGVHSLGDWLYVQEPPCFGIEEKSRGARGECRGSWLGCKECRLTVFMRDVLVCMRPDDGGDFGKLPG